MEVLEKIALEPKAQPAYPNYFADPFVWRHGNEYFAIGTGEREADGHPGEMVFPLLRSDNFRRWEFVGRALLRPDHSLGMNFWAPEIAFHEGKFFLYYSVGFADTRHQLRVATSDTPLGPFQDFGNPLFPLSHPMGERQGEGVHSEVCPFAIDAHPFRDDDGQWYLFFARDYLDNGEIPVRSNEVRAETPEVRAARLAAHTLSRTSPTSPLRVGTGLAVARMKSMTELEAEPRVVLRAQHDWQRFQAQRPIYGGVHDWHTIEGPFIRKHDSRYYCFYSAGRWENETYGVDYCVADNVLGPYSAAGNESGARVLRTVPGLLIGPGHNSVVIGPDGHDRIVYHAWDPAMTARRMFIDRLVWTPQGPRCERWLTASNSS